MEIQKIAQLINNSTKVIVLTHQKPDGDAIGSSLAIYWALIGLGKQVRLVCRDPLPQAFTFLPGSQQFKKNFLIADGNLVLIIDCGDLRRTGFAERLKKYLAQKATIINIDHHPRNDLVKLAKFNLVDPSSASTAQIIFDLLESLKVFIDPVIATALFTGVYYDTGGFKHANTDIEVLDFASKMMTFGVEMKKFKRMLPLHKISALKLWGYAFSKINLDARGVAKVIISKADFAKLSATENDILGLANIISSMNEVNIALVLWQTKEGWRGMLRTQKENIDVSKLAKYLGGGGYRKTAGFLLNQQIFSSSDLASLS